MSLPLRASSNFRHQTKKNFITGSSKPVKNFISVFGSCVIEHNLIFGRAFQEAKSHTAHFLFRLFFFSGCTHFVCVFFLKFLAFIFLPLEFFLKKHFDKFKNFVTPSKLKHACLPEVSVSWLVVLVQPSERALALGPTPAPHPHSASSAVTYIQKLGSFWN
jgi:hypothetical protein